MTPEEGGAADISGFSSGSRAGVESNAGRKLSQESNVADVTCWKAALSRVQQAQTLLNTPLSSGQPLPAHPSMHDGLLYGLNDLIYPMDGVLQMRRSGAQGLAAAIGADQSSTAAPTPTQGLHTFLQNATSMLHIANQVVSMLRSPLTGMEPSVNALEVLEQEQQRRPLEPNDKRDIILRMRKKRRISTDSPPCQDSRQKHSTSATQSVRAPLQPIPSSLTFQATTAWIERVTERCRDVSLLSSVEDLVHEFHLYMKDRCLEESSTLTNSQGNRTLPPQRVRARVSLWSSKSGTVFVELRDVGLVSIELQLRNNELNIMSMSMCSPSEYPHIQSSSSALLPSRFMFYGDISNHLLVYALSHQRSYGHGLAALAHTLLHVAGLRTLYDPLPVPAPSVAPIISRLTYGTLDWNATLDREQCIVWKWCQVVSPIPSNQGEWCAYVPGLM